MQIDWKLVKKSSKSAQYDKNKEQFRKIKDFQDLLKIELMSMPHKKLEKKVDGYQPLAKQSHNSTRKSHKSLNTQAQLVERAVKVKQTATNSEQSEALITKRKASKPQAKQPVKPLIIQTQKHEESTVAASNQYEYVEKKLKVGNKTKGNAMKEFILQTLNKAKAEGTCLVIHKGTAQCGYTPIIKNKSETTKHQKEEFPLVLVQEHKPDKTKKHNPSLFASSKKLGKNAASKSTAINLPAINKKWVKMAKQLEKNQNKNERKEEIIEVIQENIEVTEDSKVYLMHEEEEIKEEIERNQSIVRQ